MTPIRGPQDVQAIMQLTDPKHVYFICDTGHTTMAGMDPVKLTRDYTSPTALANTAPAVPATPIWHPALDSK